MRPPAPIPGLETALLPHRARGHGASRSTGVQAGVFRHPVGALLQALTGFLPNALRPCEAAPLGRASGRGAMTLVAARIPGPTPEPFGMQLGLNLRPRNTDNADADLCPYQPLIPMMSLSPCVTFVPLSGETLATRPRYVKS